MSSQNQYGEYFTPPVLVESILDKLPEEVWSNPNLKWLDPASGSGNFLISIAKRLMIGLGKIIPDPEERVKHIQGMIYGVEIQPNLVQKSYLIMSRYIIDPNIYQGDALTYDYPFQFDIIVANPPYQKPRGSRASGGKTSLWDAFVHLALDKLLKPDGYMCFIHPARWRKPGDPLWTKITRKQILHLEIYDSATGKRVFNAATQFDWYILQNRPRELPSIVKGADGKLYELDFQEWPWLPNNDFPKIQSILSPPDESKLLFSCAYHRNNKSRVSDTKDEEHIYPCVHTGKQFVWSNTNEKGLFGIPKVIFSDGGSGEPIIDLEGQYGMTQHAMAIPVNSLEEAEEVRDFLKSKEFKKLLLATRWSSFRIDHLMFNHLEEKFWRKIWSKELE